MDITLCVRVTVACSVDQLRLSVRLTLSGHFNFIKHRRSRSQSDWPVAIITCRNIRSFECRSGMACSEANQ